MKTTPSSGGTNLPFAVISVAGSVGTTPSSGGPTPSSGGTTQSFVVTKVVPPTMGGVIVEGGKTPVEIAFSGGKPNPAWTHLVKQKSVNDSPNQLRSVESKCTTAFSLRRAGLDFPDGGVIDNDDAVVDPIRVERERDRDRAKIEDVLSAVAHKLRKNNPKEWVNAVLSKLSLIGVTDTTILQQLLPTLNQRLRSVNMSAFHRVTLAGISSEVSKSLVTDFRQGQALVPDPSLWFCPATVNDAIDAIVLEDKKPQLTIRGPLRPAPMCITIPIDAAPIPSWSLVFHDCWSFIQPVSSVLSSVVF